MMHNARDRSRGIVVYRMSKFNRQQTLRIARLVLPLGKGEAAAETVSDVFSELPPEEEPIIQFRIPIEMIRAALERKRKQEREQSLPAPCPTKRSGVRFTLPLMRVEIPLSPRDELHRRSEAQPVSGSRDRAVVANSENSSESSTIHLPVAPRGVINVVTARDKPRVQGDAQMATFSINDENNISVWENAEQAAKAVDSTAAIFHSQTELTGISTEWPLSRFVDIWNSIPGQTQVRKFSDRGKAVARIWRAIQPLAPNGEPSESKVEQPKKKSLRVDTKRPAPQKKRATPKNAANNAGHVNKKASVIAMMKRAKGATIAELIGQRSKQKTHPGTHETRARQQLSRGRVFQSPTNARRSRGPPAPQRRKLPRHAYAVS